MMYCVLLSQQSQATDLPLLWLMQIIVYSIEVFMSCSSNTCLYTYAQLLGVGRVGGGGVWGRYGEC